MAKYTLEIILVAAIVIMAGVFLYQTYSGEHAFEGADGAAEDAVKELNPDYKPVEVPEWVPVFEPPSGEIESLLFCLQGVIGSAIIFFFFGYYYGRRKETTLKSNGKK